MLKINRNKIKFFKLITSILLCYKTKKLLYN